MRVSAHLARRNTHNVVHETTQGRHRVEDMRPQALFALDVALVTVFAAVGRSSHSEAFSFLGLLGTAAPFLLGLLVGWGYSLARGVVPVTVREAIPMWLLTVAVGHIVRIVVGTGTAVSFIIVSLVALAVFLLLPRAIRTQMAR